MDLFKIFKNRASVQKRMAFNSAKVNRLTSDFVFSPIHINDDIRRCLSALKVRCRESVKNNPFMRRYLNLMQTNIIGDSGITLQSTVEDSSGVADTFANKLIDNKFWDFSKRQNFSVSEDISRINIENMIVSALVTDGEFFCRVIPNFKNKYGFAIQPFDSILIDIEYNEELRNGNIVINGVEVNSYGKPINYYYKKSKPNTYNQYIERVALPANEIIHIFIKDFVGQTRGIPLAQNGLIALNNLNAYTEAEIIAARVAACKGGFYVTAKGQSMDLETDSSDNSLVSEISPGTFEVLPEGMSFEQYNPQHPNGNHSEFTKTVLREIASAWNVSYNSLAGDYESVNYSSLRASTIEERDFYKKMQNLIIESFENKIFEQWLEINLLNGNLNPLPYSKFDKFNNYQFVGRKWAWVDPEKDLKAEEIAVELGIKTRQQICNENGTDFNENMIQLQTEKNAINSGLIKDLAQQKSNFQSNI